MTANTRRYVNVPLSFASLLCKFENWIATTVKEARDTTEIIVARCLSLFLVYRDYLNAADKVTE